MSTKQRRPGEACETCAQHDDAPDDTKVWCMSEVVAPEWPVQLPRQHWCPEYQYDWWGAAR